MSSFLLDTNVVSELTKKTPNSSVVNFMQQHHDLWLSVVVIHELEFGLHLLSDTQHRDALRRTLGTLISYYQDRILRWDTKKRNKRQNFALKFTDPGVLCI